MANTANKQDYPVDIVITWVDGSDPAWQAEKANFTPENKAFKTASNQIRFRNWDNLQYIFRGIERYMPWVNKVFFVTWGHLPSWLNTEHSKLRIVRHDEYIPEEYRPTFNSNVIEMNLHRIPDLSERFINFNDDTFIIGSTQKSDFFLDGLPLTTAVLSPYPITPQGIACTEVNNLEIINTYFSMQDVKAHLRKWLTLKYGQKMLRTLLFMQFSTIIGIFEPHAPLSLRKSTLETLWKKEPAVMHNTSRHRFRTKEDINIWLLRQWQIMEGNFIPRSPKFEKLVTLPNGLDTALRLLDSPGKCRLLCMNDSMLIENFEETKHIINDALKRIFPKPSQFEK